MQNIKGERVEKRGMRIKDQGLLGDKEWKEEGFASFNLNFAFCDLHF
jgi:hypothetical protein